MSCYKHIFFDLDHTLWDFEKNCSETLRELFFSFSLSSYGFSVEDFIENYFIINNRIWDNYHRGIINKAELRESRFSLTFEELGVNSSLVPERINEEFLKICPSKGNVINHAHAVLSYLSEKYCLHIITNGFKDTQYIKISTSNLDTYFAEIIDSENSGYSKPDKRIFDFALNKTGANSTECVMIGDDLYADVLGAKNAGWDNIYFNPKRETHKETITHEITCLSELMQIL